MLERLSALKDSSVGHGVKSQTPSLAVRPPLGTRQWDANNDQPSLMPRYPVRTAIGAVVVLVLAQTYCSFMTPWIVLLFALWVLGGSKLT